MGKDEEEERKKPVRKISVYPALSKLENRFTASKQTAAPGGGEENMTFPLALSPFQCLYFETSGWKTKGFSAVIIPAQSGWDLKVILLSEIAAWAAPL